MHLEAGAARAGRAFQVGEQCSQWLAQGGPALPEPGTGELEEGSGASRESGASSGHHRKGERGLPQWHHTVWVVAGVTRQTRGALRPLLGKHKPLAFWSVRKTLILTWLCRAAEDTVEGH